MVEKWGDTVMVEQCWWNSDGGTVMVEQCGGTVKPCWWNSGTEMVEQCNTVEGKKSILLLT